MLVGSTFRMKTVGPTTKMNSANTIAKTILVLDSHWMPLATPDTADATNAAVSTAMMATSNNFDGSLIQPTSTNPEPICAAPSPREATVPNRVAKIARMSMTLPPQPLARWPRMGAKTALTNCPRPHR